MRVAWENFFDSHLDNLSQKLVTHLQLVTTASHGTFTGLVRVIVYSVHGEGHRHPLLLILPYVSLNLQSLVIDVLHPVMSFLLEKGARLS